MSGPLILAVESSCDETGIALVEDGRRIHSNVVASQTALHAATGTIQRRWARAATSGTIPPVGAWSATCEATTLAWISRPSNRRATRRASR